MTNARTPQTPARRCGDRGVTFRGSVGYWSPLGSTAGLNVGIAQPFGSPLFASARSLHAVIIFATIVFVGRRQRPSLPDAPIHFHNVELHA
jgi:hypothetical protein